MVPKCLIKKSEIIIEIDLQQKYKLDQVILLLTWVTRIDLLELITTYSSEKIVSISASPALRTMSSRFVSVTNVLSSEAMT